MDRELTPQEKKEERKKQIKIKRRKRVVSFALFMSLLGGIVSSSLIVPTTQVMLGKNIIANSFYNEVISGDIGWYDSYNTGYNFIKNGQPVSYDYAMSHIYDRAKDMGYDNEEIYIALSKIISSSAAKQAVGYKPDKDDLNKVARVHFYEDKIEDLNKSVEENQSHGK